MPAPDALSADMVALDTAPGTSDVRLIPLRESTLALVGTLLVVRLEIHSATTAASRRAFASESGIGNVAKPPPRGATRWEQFVIGLDRDFDQFRRAFREESDDNGEPNMENGEGPSAWERPRVIDEAIASHWTDDAASSLAGCSGLTDSERAESVQVSLSQVALALVVGCACFRCQRPRQAHPNPKKFFRSGSCRARVS
jgi:hypothetical protein